MNMEMQMQRRRNKIHSNCKLMTSGTNEQKDRRLPLQIEGGLTKHMQPTLATLKKNWYLPQFYRTVGRKKQSGVTFLYCHILHIPLRPVSSFNFWPSTLTLPHALINIVEKWVVKEKKLNVRINLHFMGQITPEILQAHRVALLWHMLCWLQRETFHFHNPWDLWTICVTLRVYYSVILHVHAVVLWIWNTHVLCMKQLTADKLWLTACQKSIV